MRHMRPTQLKQHLEQSEKPPLLLDVREPWEYQICHIDGAELVPMRTIPAALGRFDREQEIVVICHHGIRSRQVAAYMEHQGFSNIINLQGGIAGWAQEVDPGMPTY